VPDCDEFPTKTTLRALCDLRGEGLAYDRQLRSENILAIRKQYLTHRRYSFKYRSLPDAWDPAKGRERDSNDDHARKGIPRHTAGRSAEVGLHASLDIDEPRAELTRQLMAFSEKLRVAGASSLLRLRLTVFLQWPTWNLSGHNSIQLLTQ